jgi:hypothetical protein
LSLVCIVLILTVPTLTRAGDYETELRMLDLEQRMLDLA